VLALARPFLAARGIEQPRLEAELLVAHALGLTRLELYCALERPIDDAELGRARELLRRRAKREPTAYLVGAREFYGRTFTVTPACLIPRPETERLVDLARERLAGCAAPRIAELGTGSGCIALTLRLELPSARIVASDVSPAALAVARANAERLDPSTERPGARAEPPGASAEGALEFVLGDALAPLFERAGAGYDLLVSNPPYVDPAHAPDLSVEVREHEPALALYAPTGRPDHWVELLLEQGLALLAPGGALLVELGADQAPRVRTYCQARGLAAVFHTDLERIERVLEVRRV
jgi:release factor glutamine methyltransferase